MKKGKVPTPGINIDARWWGYSHTKEGWSFWIQTTSNMYNKGKLVAPLTAADVTTAIVQDNQMYVPLTSIIFIFFCFLFTNFILYGG